MEDQDLGVNAEPLAEVQEIVDIAAQGAVSEETQEHIDTPSLPQTPEENAVFADMRRKEELEQKSKKLFELEGEIAKEKDKYTYLEKALQGMGYEGSAYEIADKLQAQTQGVSVEAVRRQREDTQKAIVEKTRASEELAFYKEQYNKTVISNDVKAISKKYPDVETFEDLPDGFFEIMATGKIKDPLKVYALLLPQKETPPSSGSVTSTQAIEKDFYTEKEVDGLSEKELNNPKILDKIMKSMSKW
ncbi:MAG: hypothetical protein RR827_03720 [Oscillospiraceae bacterium]